MGVKNRRRREEKKRLRERKQKQKRRKAARPPSDSRLTPTFRSFPNPFEGLTEDEIGQRKRLFAEAAEQQFQQSLFKVKEILHKADPLGLISNLAAYSLFQTVGDDGIQCRLDDRLNQSHVEIFQALILRHETNDLRWGFFTPHDVNNLMEALAPLCRHFSFREYDGIDNNASQIDKTRFVLRKMIQSYTTSVRNWGNFSQVVSISREIYSFLDDDVKKSNGFSISEVIELFSFLVTTIENRLNERLLFLREICKDPKNSFNNYCEFLGCTSEQKQKMLLDIDLSNATIESQKLAILTHSDQHLRKRFEFSPSYIAENCFLTVSTAKKILNRFSFQLGELAEQEIEDIFLSNPVWGRPIIKLEEEEYFCAIPQVFFSFIIPSLNNLVDELGTRHSTKLHKKRSKFLEHKIAEIIGAKLPDAQILPGLKWTIDGINGETDLLVVYDSVALIVEAKSGKVSSAALRGAPERMRRDIQKLLVEPSQQSNRFKKLLERLSKNPEETNEIRSKIPVDLSSIHKIIRTSVTMEDFAALQSQLLLLEDANWLSGDFEPCATFTLTEFETLFDVLDKPIHVFHYLNRRIAVEKDLHPIGTETDMIGFYLDTLFNYGDLGENFSAVTTGMSKKLDHYYESKEAGVLLPKPRPNMSKLFTGILEHLNRRKPSRWIELGMCLNRFSPDDQNKLTKMIQHAKTAVRRNWIVERHMNTIIYRPPTVSSYALCYVVYCDKNELRREELIFDATNEALKPDHVTHCLVVANNIDLPKVPYTHIRLIEKNTNGSGKNNNSTLTNHPFQVEKPESK